MMAARTGSAGRTRGDPIAEIMAVVHAVAGIRLTEGKRSLVEARLGKRLRQLGCDLAGYAVRIGEDDDELVRCLDLISTNHTAWRREPAHFDDLARRVVPAAGGAPLRIWCAAAATGEEPWTIALALHRAGAHPDSAILATDISTRALAVAKAGRYGGERIAALDPVERQIAVEPVPGSPGLWSVTRTLRRMVSFARLNLMEDWPMRGPFDAIFCRNVMIYFDQPTQERLVNRLAGLLVRGGTLYVGHSESLSALAHPLATAGPATYVRH